MPWFQSWVLRPFSFCKYTTWKINRTCSFWICPLNKPRTVLETAYWSAEPCAAVELCGGRAETVCCLLTFHITWNPFLCYFTGTPCPPYPWDPHIAPGKSKVLNYLVWFDQTCPTTFKSLTHWVKNNYVWLLLWLHHRHKKGANPAEQTDSPCTLFGNH